MDIQIGKKLFGFTVTGLRPVPGSEAQLVQMIYDKTGTELCWFKTDESNKLFGIAFKTVPEDDTGVFHILEHSVLCGSDKYPVKEPFVELLKSSMNTFLNAMTFPDKTLYPVSSRNEQDFLNLTSVYLDAVFVPRILRNPNIFRQEGWHYELSGDELTYNGVVFNEMKGASASVDDIAERGMMKLLFPDNCYRYNSGGDPAAIPNLSYEQYVDTYRRNYHPSNAFVYLDGDVPLEKVLSMLDEYLSRYDMGEKQPLAIQSPVCAEKTVSYEAVNDGTPKAQLVMGKILGTYEEKLPLLARQVLCDVLAGSNDAPLKRAVLETGLCQDMTLGITDGLIQPFMMLRLMGMEDKDSGALEVAIRDCARKLVSGGIPREQLTASINHFAFQVKQMQEPQGLIRCMDALNAWLYGGDPMLYLHYEDCFDALRTMAENGGFEPLLEEMLLDESGLCKLHVLPSESYGAELRQAELARLEKEKAAFTAEQLEEIAREYAQFTTWQQTPDSPRQLAALPKLSLAEISPEPVFCESEVETVSGVTLLRHKAPSNGIVHINLYFRLTECSLEELTKLSLLSQLLGSLPTKDMDAAALQNEVKTWLGNLGFGIDVFGKNSETCTPMLVAQCSVLKENLSKAEELIVKILTSTDFHQADRIREIIMQTEMEQQQVGMMNGHSLAASAVLAHYSAAGAAQEAAQGISNIRWVHRLSKNFDAELEGFTALLEKTLAETVCKARMTVSVTEDGSTDVSSLIARFPEGTACRSERAYQTELPQCLGIRIPAQVSYAVMGTHLGLPYDGTARLVSNILSLEYLWNEIRVQGGAYGAGMRIRRSGDLFAYSYRDPAPSHSLEVYRGMAEFVRTVCGGNGDISGFIISTIAETEPLTGAAQQGAIADRNWFTGFGYAEALAERKALLGATAADLEKWSAPLETLKDDAAICVVGYADALDSCAKENMTIFDI